MVNIVENWAKIEGIVKDISDNTDLKGYKILAIMLTTSKEVPAYPNLAKIDEGSLIKINIAEADYQTINPEVNKEFTGTVRKAPKQVYFLK